MLRFLLAFVLVTPVQCLLAQTATAQLTGAISDSSGAVIAGARVIVTNTGTGLTREIPTNDTGYNTAPLLPPGAYSVLNVDQTAGHHRTAGPTSEQL